MTRWMSWIGAATLGGLVAGCGAPSAGEKSATTPSGTTSKAVAFKSSPEAPVPESKITGNLEVVAFKGGYDIDHYQKSADEFAKLNPGLKVDVAGDPRVWEKLRTRLVAGDVPDLIFPGWGMDQWALAKDGQLMTLDKALDGPAADGKGTWRSTFDPNILKLCQYEGKTYMLPYYTMEFGWWYDPHVFQAHNWTPPKTYTELLALCEKIKAAGIAPITYQGQYPYYMIQGMLMPWALSVGGTEAVHDAQNLVPGAWKSPAMLKAAQMIDELNQKGYFQKGAVGMTHTASQTEFVNGRAAMIPCGTWLYTEMQKSMPATAQMEFFLPPVVEGGKGDPTALMIGIEPWMVPTAAKNPAGAIALFRYMTSLPVAKDFVEKKGTLMSIVGSDKTKLPAVLVKPAEAVHAAKVVYSYQIQNWYKAMEKDLEGAITAMLNKEITPEKFVDRCEAAAEKTRNDSKVAKYKVSD